MIEHGLYGGQRERVTHERAGKEGHADGWVGVIAELPGAAIERIHELSFAGQDANGHAAGKHLSVSGQVGSNIEKGLAAAGMHAEAGDNFIEDQSRAGVLSDLAD